MGYSKVKKVIERLTREKVSNVEIRAAQVVREIADPTNRSKIGIKLTKDVQQEMFERLVLTLQEDVNNDFNTGRDILADIFSTKIPLKTGEIVAVAHNEEVQEEPVEEIIRFEEVQEEPVIE